jgi:hypothetical protein
MTPFPHCFNNSGSPVISDAELALDQRSGGGFELGDKGYRLVGGGKIRDVID